MGRMARLFASVLLVLSWVSLTSAGEVSRLPDAPPGYRVRVVWEAPEPMTRVVADPDGQHLLVLLERGDVHRLDPATGETTRLLEGEAYAGLRKNRPSALGLAISPVDRRMYVVVNVKDPDALPIVNHVTIFRTAEVSEVSQTTRQVEAVPVGGDLEPRAWLVTEYPYGINAYNHGVSHLAFGPDGMVYVGSGSRTDHGEAGEDSRYSQEGEHPLTSAIWRIDPALEQPTRDDIEIYADGLRNPFGFAWDGEGGMFAIDHGPNADPPGELNHVEEGRDYGFPYVFSDWEDAAYEDQARLPEGFEAVPPLLNIGPGGGGSEEKPLATFTPHAAPCGMTYLGEGFGEEEGWFAIARYGALIRGVGDPGHDVVLVRPGVEEGGEIRRTRCRSLLTGLGRPIDVCTLPGGRLYVAEHTRGRWWGDRDGERRAGRVLEVTRE